MSLFESASLVVTPNGTKASKLYAVKPTDGAGDLSVTRATTATRVNSAGLIESVASNVPRLDYTNSTCPSILVEPQRTNLTLYSEEISNAVWTKEGLSLTANAIASPSGVQNADLLKETTANSQHRIFQNAVTTILGQPITFSAYAKYSGRKYIYLRVDADGENKIAFFDIQNGVVSTLSSGVTASIKDAGNGWYRCIMSVPSVTLFATAEGLIGLANTNSFPSIYVGNTSIGVYLWGVQIETNSTYATSYIPTTSASVTRNADVISKTGISSLIGQTEGTLFYDGFYGNEINEVYLFLQKEISTSVDDSIYIQQSAARIALNVYFGSTQQVFIADGAFTVGQRIKIAASYKNNDFVLYVNGVQIGTDNTGSVPTCGYLQFASYRGTPTASNFIANKGCKISAFWKTRLTNAELAELTTI